MQSRAILSAQNGNCRMRHDLPRFIRMMEAGWVTPEPAITNRYPLDAINDALAASIDKPDLSGIILPSHSRTAPTDPPKRREGERYARSVA